MKPTAKQQIQQARAQYEAVPVPAELSARLEQTIAQHPFSGSAQRQLHWRKPAIAAACFLALLALCNLNPAMAQAVERIPLLGPITRVFIIQTWQQQDEATAINITQPALDGDSALAQSINAEIAQIVADRTTEAQQRLDDYKQAFLATGGTEAQWAEHHLQVQIDYQILSQSQQTLSFVVTSTEDWSNAYTETYYYNLDLQTNKQLTLQDLLGDNYIQIANDSICQQMKARMEANPDLTYFDQASGGFTSIDDATKFYINQAGNPVIVFDRYAIAPGFMGQQQFEIEKE